MGERTDKSRIAADVEAIASAQEIVVLEPVKGEDFEHWLLSMHVAFCKTGGVGCSTCNRARELGVEMPA